MDTLNLATVEPTDPRDLDALLEDKNFNKSLDERGIIPPWSIQRNATGLTSEQISVIAVLMNPKDRRSDSKKLTDLGISTRKYGGWTHNKHYVAYATKVANNLLANVEGEAHMGLIRKVIAGDNAATKLYFEMTGRWNPAHESEVNMQTLMGRFVEIIQTHVRDPKILSKIAADLQLASVETGIRPEAIMAGKERAAVMGAPVGPVDKKFALPERKLTF